MVQTSRRTSSLRRAERVRSWRRSRGRNHIAFMPAVVSSCDIWDWMAEAPLGLAEGNVNGLDGNGTLSRGRLEDDDKSQLADFLELKLPSAACLERSGGPSWMSRPHISLGRPRSYP